MITTVTDAIDYMGMESTVHCPLQAPPRAVGFGRFQWLLMAYTGFAWIADAMEIMLLSYLAPAAQCAFDLTSGQVSFLSSIVFIGVAIGAWVWSPVADFYGRKRGFAITGLGTAVFSIATALAPSYWVLLAFRFCVGVGLGGVPIIFSLFAEFVPTKRRGVALVAIQVRRLLNGVICCDLLHNAGLLDNWDGGRHAAHCCNAADAWLAVDGGLVCHSNVPRDDCLPMAARIATVDAEGQGERLCSTPLMYVCTCLRMSTMTFPGRRGWSRAHVAEDIAHESQAAACAEHQQVW